MLQMKRSWAWRRFHSSSSFSSKEKGNLVTIVAGSLTAWCHNNQLTDTSKFFILSAVVWVLQQKYPLFSKSSIYSACFSFNPANTWYYYHFESNLNLQVLISTKTAPGFRTLTPFVKIIQSFILMLNTWKQVLSRGGKFVVPFSLNIGCSPNFLD